MSLLYKEGERMEPRCSNTRMESGGYIQYFDIEVLVESNMKTPHAIL